MFKPCAERCDMNKSRSRGGSQRHRATLRWTELPHKHLASRIERRAGQRSFRRADDDAVRRLLRRRLAEGDPRDHRRYLESCARWMVRQLRATRDVYRDYLEQCGAKPLREMYWVVFEFAVVPTAVELVRDLALDYVCASEIPEEDFQQLCSTLFSTTGLEERPPWKPGRYIDWFKVQIKLLVGQDTLQQGIGTPDRLALFFGQPRSLGSVMGSEQLRKDRRPWGDALSGLFHAAHDELRDQASDLSGTKQFLLNTPLSPVERIVYKHLYDMRSTRIKQGQHRFGDEGWKALMLELDAAKISLDENLDPNGLRVLRETRKRTKVVSWAGAYQTKILITLFPKKENSGRARQYKMKRVVTKALTNIGRNATKEVKRIFGRAVPPEHFDESHR
jgi:hypothetical protein